MTKKQIKNYDLRKILKPFEDKWVALTIDNKKVIASGNNLKEVSLKTKDKEVIFMKVLPFRVSYAPIVL